MTDSPKISDQAAYTTMLAEFDFLKKQQWSTANYAVLIYGALLWVRSNAQTTPTTNCLLTTLALATAIVAIVVLCDLQRSLGDLRLRHKHARTALFSPFEQDALKLEGYDENVYLRGWRVLFALIGVCVLGAVLVLVVVYWPAPPTPPRP